MYAFARYWSKTSVSSRPLERVEFQAWINPVAPSGGRNKGKTRAPLGRAARDGMRDVQHVPGTQGTPPGPRTGYTLTLLRVLNERKTRVKGVSQATPRRPPIRRNGNIRRTLTSIQETFNQFLANI